MKKLLLLFTVFLLFNINATEKKENSIFENQGKEIANKISEVLIKEYDNYKDKSFQEKVVLKLGKNAFLESILKWKNNFQDVDNIKIELNYHLENMANIAEKNLAQADSAYFRKLLNDLTLLAYKNLDLYFKSVKEYLKNNNFTSDRINIEVVDKSISNKNFFDAKKNLYSTERKIKKEIYDIMKRPELKFKMGIYIFAFNFFNKIREKVIENDLLRMEKLSGDKK